MTLKAHRAPIRYSTRLNVNEALGTWIINEKDIYIAQAYKVQE